MNSPVDPVIAGGAKRDHSIDGTNPVGKPILEGFGSDREIELLDLSLDRVLEEEFDQHFSRGPGRESHVEGRLVPDEAAQIFESEVEGKRSTIEQHHVESEPTAGMDFPHQLPIEVSLRRIEKLAGRGRSRPAGPVLLEKHLQIAENFLLACASMEAKLSRFTEETGVPLQAGLVWRLQAHPDIPADSHRATPLGFA